MNIKITMHKQIIILLLFFSLFSLFFSQEVGDLSEDVSADSVKLKNEEIENIEKANGESEFDANAKTTAEEVEKEENDEAKLEREESKVKNEIKKVQNKNLDLIIAKEDTYVLPGNDGGFHLYIRAKGDIASVLLTETTQDPSLKLHNYAYRDIVFNEINGNERRLLNGEPLDISKGLYSLIDSTVEDDTPLGKAFHIWIPHIIVYGYSWSRHGELEVVDGTFINIRSFELPFGDYEGAFKDNPFVLKIDDIMLNYIHEAVASFKDITGGSGGDLVYAKGASDIIPLTKRIVFDGGMGAFHAKNADLDLMFVLDATESMKEYVEYAKTEMIEFLKICDYSFASTRVGLILYKDYGDDFVVKEACVFTSKLERFVQVLNEVKVSGGGDIPEAVYEGLFLALRESWREDENVIKKIVLVGDAPPHNKPRGKVKKADVEAKAKERGVEINTILLSSMAK